MNDTAIKIEGLGKRYRLGVREQGYKTLREALVSAASAPVRNFKRLRSLTHFSNETDEANVLWALRDVSFSIKRGEVIGIIGANGAGKSTLLKILSKITKPTTGFAEIHGRVASLLEVGTGFHNELSGRENIYLNGTILGMKKKEIDRQFDAIVEFSGVEKFIDTPVKHFSSGMQVRLAFAVAAHLDPEILIIDEVLAVGDAAFQEKCLGQMSAIASQGRTVVFVSHNMGAVNQLCERAILLKDGRLSLDGTPSAITANYLENSRRQTTVNTNNFAGPLAPRIKFDKLAVNSQAVSNSIVVSPSSKIMLSVEGEALEAIPDCQITFSVFRDGSRLFTLHDVEKPEPLQPGSFRSQIEIPALLLRPGEYSIALGALQGYEWMWGTDLGHFYVNEEWATDYQEVNLGVINLPQNGRRVLLAQESGSPAK